MRLDQHHRLVEALHTGVLPTPLCRSKRGKSRRAVKTGSDTITFFALYGTMIHGCQGAVVVRWYREEGLSELGTALVTTSYSNATINPGGFKVRSFCVKPLKLRWILGIHRSRETPGLFCWITVALRRFW